MAKISLLPPIETINGGEKLVVVQDGETRQGNLRDVFTPDAAAARAALYAITDAMEASTFGAFGVELDFVAGYFRNGYQITSSVMDQAGFDFVRETLGTVEVAPGTVLSFAEGQPRIVPGQGLYIGPGVQNFLLRSQEFEHAAWDRINAGAGVAPVIVANDAAAPDGTMTADKITFSLGGSDTPGDRSHIQQDLAPVAGVKYAGSLFVKGVAGEKILMRHVAGGGYTLHEFNGQWQRMSAIEVAAGGFSTFEFGLRGGFGVSDAVTFHAWGAQIETGDAVTPYVATGEFSFTTDADTARIGGLNLGDATIIVEAVLKSGASDTDKGHRSFLTAYSGSGVGNIVTLINDDAGGIGMVAEAGGVTSAIATAEVAARDSIQRFAMRLRDYDSLLVRNGAPRDWLFEGPVPDVITTLCMGGSPLSETARLGGYIRKIVIVPFAMSQRQTLVNGGGDAPAPAQVSWNRVVRSANLPRRDSAKTFRMGAWQYVAGGYKPGVGDAAAVHDLWRSADGRNFELVHANPGFELFSHVIALGGVIYAWRTQMWKSVDGGLNWVKILNALPWGTSSYDNPRIVHRGKLLFIHCTGDAPGGNEGVWQFDPVAVAWNLVCAAPWGARDIPALVEFDDKLFLYGGSRNTANVPPEVNYPGKTTLNDMWESTDGGLTFVRTVADMPCAPRMWPVLIPYLGRLYMLGGFDNVAAVSRNFDETWVSDDGLAWAKLEADQHYLQRHAPIAYEINGELLLATGNANAAAATEVLNDIWRLIP
jgi:hypothetical protein